MSARDYFYRIDALKIVAAVMVVLIHTSVYLPYTQTATIANYYWYSGILEFAVPAFFLASGFLLGRKTPSEMVSTAGKIFALYLAATIFYMLMGLLSALLDVLILKDPAGPEFSNLFANWTIKGFILGTMAQGHLWFLAAMCIAVLVFASLKKLKVPPSLILVITIALWIWKTTFILGGSIPAILIDLNGTGTALIYMALGLLIWKHQIQPQTWHLIAGIGAMLAYSLVRITMINGSSPDTVLLLKILAINALLTLGVTLIGIWATNPTTSPTRLSKYGQYSLTIYILHMAIINVINRTMTYTGVNIDSIRGIPGYAFISAALIVVICIWLHKPFTTFIYQPTQRLANKTYAAVGALPHKITKAWNKSRV